MALIELSHVIEDGMTTYPGLPGPLVCDYLTREASREHYAGGATFHIGKLEMIANTGTYVDAPFHRYEDGIDIEAHDFYGATATDPAREGAPSASRSTPSPTRR